MQILINFTNIKSQQKIIWCYFENNNAPWLVNSNLVAAVKLQIRKKKKLENLISSSSLDRQIKSIDFSSTHLQFVIFSMAKLIGDQS